MKKIVYISLVLMAIFSAWIWLSYNFPWKSLIRSPYIAEAIETDSGASKTYSIQDLICFKCHVYENFQQDPSPGVFSHALHVQFEYHCNQCHSFRGHRQMVMNTTVCTFCHESVPQLKKH